MNIGPNFSSIWISFLALSGGLTMLVVGGELLVGGAVRLASRQGMSPLLIGLTVVAFGTSLPELFVSLSATLQGHADVMVGNVVGSNIANIGMVLAFSAVLYPLRVRLSKITTELYILIGASFVVVVICWFGFFYRFLGFGFVVGLVLYTVVAYRRAQKKDKHRAGTSRDEKRSSYGFIGVMVFVGLIMLAVGSDFFIEGAVDLARFFGVSELVIGLTLAAIGTSLPELASSASAIRHRAGSLLVGNIVGSNIFNLLMVMGGTATITPFSFSKDVLTRDLPVMIAFSAILVSFLLYRPILNRLQGGVLLGAYGTYIWLLV